MIRILYVEDEPFLAKIVKETLESKDYFVSLIADGAHVIDAFNRDKFDVCVLDIMLPNKSGYEIANEIRILNAIIPILFLTAKDQTVDVLKGFQSGCNDYIRKPFSMEELMVRIDNLVSLLNINSDAPLESIKLGNQFEFYPIRLELHFAGEILKLSHRETEILKMLSDNMNGITKRKDILLKIWGDDSFYNSRNLDVYITKIRSFLKEDPKLRITTLKGVGYQFVVLV
ncbi:MAG: DNA-binding response OmpR family regulator [Saprospiraceae bacterium]|jgi:DNA-binding response OmpR family regulator